MSLAPRGDFTVDAAFAEQVERARAQLAEQGFGARVGLVLGSGLAELIGGDAELSIGFGEIDGFHVPSVEGHRGRLAQVSHEGVDALVLQGRLHAYEGIGMPSVVHPVAVMIALGCELIILTNAAGGLHRDFLAGDIMAITGLVDLHLDDATRGLLIPPRENTEAHLRAATKLGPFDRALTHRLVERGATRGMTIRTGTYASLWGPTYETPREIGFLRRIGADAVGMSTGPEAALAHRLGARVVGLSCITNVAREDGGEVVTHDEVVEVGGRSNAAIAELLLDFLGHTGIDS